MTGIFSPTTLTRSISSCRPRRRSLRPARALLRTLLRLPLELMPAPPLRLPRLLLVRLLVWRMLVRLLLVRLLTRPLPQA